MECLQELAEKGFSEEAVEASLNTLEFLWREFNTGSFPKGLALILDMAGENNYGRVSVSREGEKRLLAERRSDQRTFSALSAYGTSAGRRRKPRL